MTAVGPWPRCRTGGRPDDTLRMNNRGSGEETVNVPGSKARRTQFVTYSSLLRSDHFSWPSPFSRRRILHSPKSIDSSRWRIPSLQDLCFSSAWMNNSFSCSPPPASFAFRGRVTFAGTHQRPFDRRMGTTDRYRTMHYEPLRPLGLGNDNDFILNEMD